jgi:TonB family protein
MGFFQRFHSSFISRIQPMGYDIPDDFNQSNGIYIEPLVIEYTPITYPNQAREMKIEGVVVVKINLDFWGNVKAVHILKSVHPLLDRVVTETVRKWKFSPAIKKGKPVNTALIRPFSFHITQH